MVSGTGFGNPDPAILDNKGKVNKKYADFLLNNYFSEIGGFDFKVTSQYVDVGIEPSYQGDPLLIIRISKNKGSSFIKRGKAWGPYGSRITSSMKHYSEYKYNSKFKKMIDEFHSILFKEKHHNE